MTDFSARDGEGRWEAGGCRGAGRALRARFQIGGVAAVFLGLALLSGQNVADAADKGRGDAALAAVHGQRADRREPAKRPASETVVLRGTLPTRPDAGPPPPDQSGGGGYAAPGDEGFQLGPLYGSGWDTQFDYSGLSGTYYPVPR